MSEASGEVGIFTLVDFCRALIGEGRGQQQGKNVVYLSVTSNFSLSFEARELKFCL